MQDFLAANDNVQPRGHGKALESLPRLWDQFSIFLKKYITYEGMYQIVYLCEFPLLSHLHHGNLLNMPFYLLKTLHYMDGFVRTTENPLPSVTNHGLVKLLILRSLTQQNQTWA